MTAVPDGLGAGGAALWAALGRTAGQPDGVLALEACRAVDRLEELDRVIHGQGVLELMRFRVPHACAEDDTGAVTVEVKFDSVLAEARQQQNVLRQILVTLASMGEPECVKPVEVKSPLDELNARRAARGATAKGAGVPKVARQ